MDFDDIYQASSTKTFTKQDISVKEEKKQPLLPHENDQPSTISTSQLDPSPVSLEQDIKYSQSFVSPAEQQEKDDFSEEELFFSPPKEISNAELIDENSHLEALKSDYHNESNTLYEDILSTEPKEKIVKESIDIKSTLPEDNELVFQTPNSDAPIKADASPKPLIDHQPPTILDDKDNLLIPKNSDQEEDALVVPSPAKTKNNNVFAKILLTAGPLFLVASLGLSILIINQPKQAETYVSEPEGSSKNQLNIKAGEYKKFAPSNPEAVKAYSNNKKENELKNKSRYSSVSPYFEWDEPNQKNGINVSGYIVYFGTKQNQYPSFGESETVYTNSYSPKFDLEKGKTYYLRIQTLSDSKAPVGYDSQNNEPSKLYFEYQYE